MQIKSFSLLLLLIVNSISFCNAQSDNSVSYVLTKQEVGMLKEGTSEKDPAIKIYDITDADYILMVAQNRTGYPTPTGSNWYKGDRRCPPHCHINEAEMEQAALIPDSEQESIELSTNYVLVPAQTVKNFLGSKTANYLYIGVTQGMNPEFLMMADLSEIPGE